MKKFMSVFILFVMMFLLSACTPEPMIDPGPQKETDIVGTTDTETTLDVITEVEGLPVEDGTEFYFSSGAGAWYTSLILNEDGSFTGSYHDSEMGDVGEGYPHGSVYTSEFSGRFTNIEKINSYSYRMTLEYVETEKPAGEEWIEEERRYVASEPYGIAGGEEFILYLPETPAVAVEGPFLTWWPQRYGQIDDFGNFTGDPDTILSCYGIYNVTGGFGFFVYP